MSVDFRSTPHIGAESHHYYRQPTAPTASDPLQVGDLWSDTTANLLKRCTSVSPITFVSVEGGSSSHDLFSTIHGDVDEVDIPANKESMVYNLGAAKWESGGVKLLEAVSAAPDPGTETEGQIYFDTTVGDKSAYVWVP